MKKILCTLLLAVLGLTACKKDAAEAVQAMNPNSLGKEGGIITIDTLCKAYHMEDLVLGDYLITGVVISDAASGNTPAGHVVIQDGKKGITLSMPAATAVTYAVGDSLLISLKGDTLANRLGTLVVCLSATSHIRKLGSGKTVTPVVITLSQLWTAFSSYEATLVKVVNASLNPTPGATDVYSGEYLLSDISGAYTVLLHTEATAVFAQEIVPVMGAFAGIPALYNAYGENTASWASKQLLIRNLSDVKAVSLIAGWQFGSPAAAGNEVTYAATSVDPNLEKPVLSRGSGWNPTALARGFSSNAAVVIKTKDDAVANNSYYEFTVKAKDGYSTAFNSITSRLRRSAAGANVYRWMYSLNGTDFKEVGSEDINFVSTDDGVDQAPVDLSGIEALQNVPAGTAVVFRLYAWGFNNVGSGTFAIARYASGITTNCLSLTGIVQ